MCARIGTEREVALIGGVSEIVENDPWLHACSGRCGVDAEDPIEVLRRVDDDRDVATLAGDARAAAARQHGRAVIAADTNRVDDVLDGTRNHHPDGDLPVIR